MKSHRCDSGSSQRRSGSKNVESKGERRGRKESDGRNFSGDKSYGSRSRQILICNVDFELHSLPCRSARAKNVRFRVSAPGRVRWLAIKRRAGRSGQFEVELNIKKPSTTTILRSSFSLPLFFSSPSSLRHAAFSPQRAPHERRLLPRHWSHDSRHRPPFSSPPSPPRSPHPQRRSLLRQEPFPVRPNPLRDFRYGRRHSKIRSRRSGRLEQGRGGVEVEVDPPSQDPKRCSGFKSDLGKTRRTSDDSR